VVSDIIFLKDDIADILHNQLPVTRFYLYYSDFFGGINEAWMKCPNLDNFWQKCAITIAEKSLIGKPNRIYSNIHRFLLPQENIHAPKPGNELQ
jgi:hypothetical protein